MTPKLSFVIPCYFSEVTIGPVVKKLVESLNKNRVRNYEIVLVNDGSTDNTLQVLMGLSKQNKHIKIISLSKNFGQHAAIMAGFHFVSGDIVVCLDDDGQTPPQEYTRLLKKMDEGYDVVFAKYQEKRHPLLRNLGARVNDAMARYLINKPKDISISSYFSAKRFIINEIIKYTHPYPYVSGLLISASNRIANAKINHRPRTNGQSGYSLSKLIQLWLNGFTAFSVKPLRIASVSGLVFALVGFIYSIYTIISKITNPHLLLGYASLMSALLVIGGILMIMLGLIGEYLGRMYIGFNNHPQFIIREKIGFNSDISNKKV